MFSVHCHLHFYFVGGKISDGIFKDENTPSLKSNDRLKFSQDVALNRVGGKWKPQWLSYNVFKEEDMYDTFLYISTYKTLIQL